MTSRRAASIAALAALAALAITGCSLVEAGLLDRAASATDDPSSSDASPDATGDAAGDAFPCERPDGGLKCDPGHIQCAQATCDTPAQVCCQPAADWTCVDAGTSQCTNGDNIQACDETADCPNGWPCWGTLIGQQIKSICSPKPPTFGTPFQLCRSLTECKDCKVEACFNGVLFVESCGGTHSGFCN
jgi:hypothetical protein